MMKHKKEIISLLDQILERAKYDDEKHKAEMLRAGKGSKALGSSWMIFHLSTLRGLIDDD